MKLNVVDDEAQKQKLDTLFSERGWVTTGHGVSSNSMGRVERTVDALIPGSEFLAKRAVMRDIIHLAEREAIDVQMESCQLVHPPPNPRFYRVYQEPDGGGTTLKNRLLIAAGWYDTDTSIAMPPGERVLDRERGLGTDANGRGYRLRAHALWKYDPGQNADVIARRRARVGTVGVISSFSALAIFLSIAVGFGVRGGAITLVAPLVVLSVGCAIVLWGSLRAHPGSDRRKVLLFLAFIFISLCIGAISYFGSQWDVLGIVVLGSSYFGLRFLLADASAGTVASWVVPMVLTIGMGGIPGMDGALQGFYLSQFGIDGGVSAVPVSGFWQTWPSMLTVAKGWLVALVVISPLGVIRYFHASKSILRFSVYICIPAALGIGFLVVASDVVDAVNKGKEDREQAQSASIAPRYMGIKGQFVTVSPVNDKPSSQNCLPSRGRRMISFGTNREVISLWDVEKKRSCTVRLEDYSIRVLE